MRNTRLINKLQKADSVDMFLFLSTLQNYNFFQTLAIINILA